MPVGSFDMHEVITTLAEDTGIGSAHVDDALRVFTEAVEYQVIAVREIMLNTLTVITDNTSTVSHEPETPLLVLNHGVDGMESGKRATELGGMRLVGELQHTESGCAGEYFSVLTLQEAIGITITFLPLKVSHRHIVEHPAVPGLQGTVHTEIEQTVTILHDGIYIVTGKRLVTGILPTDDTELITIVTVDTVTGGRP